jgi:hypothetical protein
MAQLPAERRRSGRRLVIAGVAIILVAVGMLIFLAADAGDGPPASGPTPSQTASAPATQPDASAGPSPSTGQAEPSPGTPPPTEQPESAPTLSATDQSLIGQITALIGALTGLILAVTGLIRIVRTRTPSE